MGALAELFCCVFEIVATIEEKRNPKPGCLAVMVVFLISAVLTIGLVLLFLG